MPATATGGQSSPSGTGQGLLRALINRFRNLMHEAGKFGVVGIVAFVIDTGLFNVAITTLNMEQLLAKTFSTVVAATVAFVGNRFWTWQNRERSGLAREYLLYFFFNAVGLGIALACLGVSRYGLGSIWPNVFKTLIADNIAANVIGLGFGTLFRFWAYRRFVFIGQPVAAASHVNGVEPGGDLRARHAPTRRIKRSRKDVGRDSRAR